MKFGIRKFSIKKRIKARTTGRLKRSAKRAINPFYGKKGMGWLHPKRKLRNALYRKTTVSAEGAAKGVFSILLFPFYLLKPVFVFTLFIMILPFKAIAALIRFIRNRQSQGGNKVV